MISSKNNHKSIKVKLPKDSPLTLQNRLKRDIQLNYGAYLIVIPVIIYFLIFSYKPMYVVIIAFKDFSPGAGIMGSPWTDSFGFQHFIDFFSSHFFWRLLRNTLTISLATIVLGFPAPILFALFLNEITNDKFKRTVQTVSYMPHFISLIVICGLIKLFTAPDGIITTTMAAMFGIDPVSLLSIPEYFIPIYVLSGIWQEIGFGSILYFAALTGIDESLYEAAEIDGASRLRKAWHITLPGISTTIIIMLILRLGSVMNVGFEKIINLYSPVIYETSDVISSYVYRKGLVEGNFSFASAVGLFNNIINFALIIVFNKISRKVSEVSLW